MSAHVRAGFPWRFERDELLRFGHCDPAGIAYFPRLDELLNGLFEDWCAAMGLPLRDLIQRDRMGFPLVHATVEYEAPLVLGDRLRLTQQVYAVGRSSLTVDLSIMRGDTRCVSARHVRVMISLDTQRAIPLPAALRARFATEPGDGA